MNQLLIGQACFIIRAGALPIGYNQRPGMTLLMHGGSRSVCERFKEYVGVQSQAVLYKFVHERRHSMQPMCPP